MIISMAQVGSNTQITATVLQVLRVSSCVPKAALVDFRRKGGFWSYLPFGTVCILKSDSFLQLYMGRCCSPLSPPVSSVNWFNLGM